MPGSTGVLVRDYGLLPVPIRHNGVTAGRRRWHAESPTDLSPGHAGRKSLTDGPAEKFLGLVTPGAGTADGGVPGRRLPIRWLHMDWLLHSRTVSATQLLLVTLFQHHNHT